jgi:hypothetical protein
MDPPENNANDQPRTANRACATNQQSAITDVQIGLTFASVIADRGRPVNKELHTEWQSCVKRKAFDIDWSDH